MQPLEAVAGECRMAWSVFADLPAVRAAAPTAADLRALRIHLQRSGLLTKDGMVNAAGSPLATWQRSERRCLPWNPLTGAYHP